MTGEPADDICERIKDALRVVIDPEIGLNVVDLGLIYDVNVEASIARILMTTTTQGCPATDYLHDGVQQAASGVSGIDVVEVTMTYDPPWNPDMIEEQSKAQLGIGSAPVY
jgi:metal-sulfur cluster biosynthetic enzyme